MWRLNTRHRYQWGDRLVARQCNNLWHLNDLQFFVIWSKTLSHTYFPCWQTKHYAQEYWTAMPARPSIQNLQIWRFDLANSRSIFCGHLHLFESHPLVLLYLRTYIFFVLCTILYPSCGMWGEDQDSGIVRRVRTYMLSFCSKVRRYLTYDRSGSEFSLRDEP